MAGEKAAVVSGEETYVSKLTIATLGCIPAAVKAEASGKLAIARLFGKADDVKYQPNKDTGETYTFFAGNFEGINMQDGTVLRSAKLFLPKGISEIVETAIKTAKSKDEKNQIAFAFEIRAVKASNPAGYSYEAVALKDPHAEDELAAMRTQLATIPTLEQKRLQAQDGGKSGKVLEGQAAKRA